MSIGQPPVRRDYAAALELGDYLHAAWRVKWMVLCCALAGVAAAAVWVRFFPSEYVSRAVIRFIPPKVSERYVTTSGDAWAEQRTAALAQTLLSSLTARKMVEGAKLYPELRRFQTAADLVPRFQRALEVKSIANRGASGSRPVATIEIGFRYTNPVVAKQVVQQMVESIYETNERYRGDQSLSTSQFLSEQAESVRQRLEELEVELGQLNRPDRTAGDHEWALKIQQLYSVENRLGHVQAALRTLKRDLADKVEEIRAVEEEIRRIPQSITANSEYTTWEGSRLKIAANDARVRLESMESFYTADHPDVAEAKKFYAELRSQLEEQTARDTEAARARARRQSQSRLDLLRADRDAVSLTIRGHENEEATLTKRAAELRALAYSTRESDTEYLRLTREYQSLSEHYKGLFRKEQESQIASEVDRQGQGEMVELLDPPVVPTRTEFPSSPVKVAFGGALGMIAGIALALARLHLRPVLRSARHLELWPGAVLLAELPGGSRAGALQGGPGGVSRWRPKLIRTSGAALLAVAMLPLSSGCSSGPGGSTQSWLRAASSAVKKGDLEQADRCYRNAIKLDARCGPAHNGLGQLLLGTGEVEEALGHFIRAAELLPADRPVQTGLADLLYRIYYSDPGRSRGTLLELEEQANRLLQHWPAQPEGYRSLALVLCERGRPAEASALIEEGIRRSGRKPELVTELASLGYRLGNPDESERMLRELIDSSSRYGQAYDLLYLQLRDRKMVAEAGEILRRKWETLGDADSGMQYAAHLESAGAREAMLRHAEVVERRLANDASAVALMGSFWVSRGETERARRLYERGAAAFPARRGEFVGKLAELEVAAGKRGEAMARIQAALAGSPKDMTLQAYRAALGLDSNNPQIEKSARLELEMIMKRMPKSAFVRFHLGRSYMKIGDVFKAGRQFERCIRLDPNYAPGWLALAESEYRTGNIALSKSRLDELLKRAPMYSSALLLKARVLHDLGQTKEIGATLELAAAAGAAEDELAVERARQRIAGGDAAGAIRLLEEAEVRSGQKPGIAVVLAWAEWKRGDGVKALARLDRSAASHPDSRELAEARGEILLRMGRIEDARGVYAGLARATPESPLYSASLADTLALSGKLKDAAEEYRRAQALPGAPASVWVRAAAVHNALGDRAAAKSAYEAALARDGSNPYALNNLAYLLGRSGQQLDYALQLAQNANQILPDSEEVQDTLIYVTLRMGLRQQAMEVLDRASARSRTTARAWYQSLRAQLAKGSPKDVLRRMEEARQVRRES